MATDQTFTRLYNKKILPLLGMKDGMLDYLRTLITEAHADMFSSDAVIGAAQATVAAGGNNQIDIASSDALRAVTGTGVTINLAAGDSRFQSIKVPPDAAAVYCVGIEQSAVDTGIETNPRTGEFEYSDYIELPGRVAAPTSITDNGNGTLSINVNSLFEAGKDNSGRSVRVWLKSRADGGLGPLSASESVAIQTITVTYSAPNNLVAVPNLLGQTVASTTASNYWVQAVGPTVKRKASEDLRDTSGCVFLADVTSVAAANPIVVFSRTDQQLVQFTLSDIARQRTLIIPGGEFHTTDAEVVGGHWQFSPFMASKLADDSTGILAGVPLPVGSVVVAFRAHVKDDNSPSNTITVSLESAVKTTGVPAGSLTAPTSAHTGADQTLSIVDTMEIEDDKMYTVFAQGNNNGGALRLYSVEIDYIPFSA